LLAAIKTAGLTDTLDTGAPYLILAPTDEAFKSLPKDKLDALLADPKALADLLRYDTASGYFPAGSLAKIPGGSGDRTLTNLLGAELTFLYIDEKWTVNGADVGALEIMWIMNGTRVMPINNLLLPTTK
jgi:uncharacterized surface protein with fasciclin (FAS1) repeats